MSQPQSIRPADHFLAVFLVDQPRNSSEPASPVEHLGTGFFVAPGIFVTCWHCVREQPPAGQTYAVCVFEAAGPRAYYLRDIERDRNGSDIATARCDYAPSSLPALGSDALTYGANVWSFGYPFPERRPVFAGPTAHVINGRMLRGYVTRHCWHDVPGVGRREVYELDMKAPEGLSGAPLMMTETHTVYGILIAENSIEMGRVVSFAIAHDTATLRNVTTALTDGVPLSQYLDQQQGVGA